MHITASDLVVCYDSGEYGSISFNVMGGTPGYEVILVNADTSAQIAVETGVSSTTTVTFDNLSAGINYAINIIDMVGCAMSETYTFTLTELPDISAVAVQNEDCTVSTYDSWIEVRFTNTSIDFTNITYTLNSTDVADAVVFTRFSNGVGYIDDIDVAITSQYVTIFYTEVINGQTKQCSYQTTNFEVVDREALTLQSVANSTINTIEVLAQGGVEPYTYYFNGTYYGSTAVYTLNVNDPEEIDPITGDRIKVIEVTVEDAIGCTVTMTIRDIFYDIEIPEYFTPDGDGNNDTWSPKNTESYPNVETHIYDRYGRKIETLRQGQSWDSLYNGKPLPSGDYWYILDLNEKRDQRKFYGHFTLYR